ncbi:hypothetical protein [Streptomyces sp. NPDC056069]|uniref:hypothetical protein n=1 Tax=Streptomyces sp. NPDC056069 TaxID=3345702 RepID=UPI0035DA4330
MTLKLTDKLIELNNRAWAEFAACALTAETADALQAEITAYCDATGRSRDEVTAELYEHTRPSD